MNNLEVLEIAKCRKDPIYYMTEYCKIRHPIRGLIKLELWDFQKECVRAFVDNLYNIILKARQLGISTIVAAYCSWMLLFFKNKEIYVLCTKGETASNLVDKVAVVFENLPDFMRPKLTVDNRRSKTLENGSSIKASGTTEDAARSESLSLLVFDELAFIRESIVNKLWVSAQPTLSTGGQCIMLSTPNGVGNFFHRTYVNAENGIKMLVGEKEISMNPIKLPWYFHPERNETWAENERKKIGIRAFAQEHDCSFEQSGNTVINSLDIEFYKKNPTVDKPYITHPKEKVGFDKGLWVWEYPKQQNMYLVSADVARGDGSDFSSFQILDIWNYEQVAEYKGKLPTDLFGYMLCQIASQYNNALMIVENNGPGWATIQKILDIGYANMFWADKTKPIVNPNSFVRQFDQYDVSKKGLTPGFNTTARTRPVIIARMEEDIRNHEIILHSQRLMSEFQTFNYSEKSGRPEALSGYNDDLIMSLAIGMFIRNTNCKINSANSRHNSVVLNGMFSSKEEYGASILGSKRNVENNPYIMKINEHDTENIAWLI